MTGGGPGGGGYLLAILVSAAVLDAEMLTLGAVDGAGAIPLSGLFPMYLVTVLVAVPVGAIGALWVELTCRRAASQWRHVLGAFCSAYVMVLWLVLAFVVLDGGPPSPGVVPELVLAVLPLALAGAAGRAAVIPLARRRAAP